MLEYEIKELSVFARECEECFDLLKIKLDSLHLFMTNKENVTLWEQWGEDEDIVSWAEKVREASVRALCDMEKFQSKRSCNHDLNVSKYITTLSKSVKQELEDLSITSQSKVLFIGSGAFPVSALTIASEKNAEVCCLDIDKEAVEMGMKIAELTGLDSRVTFSNKCLKDVPFVKKATHVIVASLVKNKLEVLQDLECCIQTRTKVIVRYGNGLKSIFNYPMEMDLYKDWSIIKSDSTEGIYDTVILEKGKVVV
nr:nicotianamine synthase family protein [Fictibacillus nanhaiensis]